MIPQPTLIYILEHENNRRGDLFGRLMADLFVALGYEQPRLNIHKSGRELDLDANHRLERRRAIAECKATASPIGGDDVNKFIGALDAEHDDKLPVTGYFVSLSGFKETAIEQEKKRRRTRIVTLNGSQVVNELVRGRILIPKERATEVAGRCCTEKDELVLDPQADLLAHDHGWIWAVYYKQGDLRTHFVLIHADGTLLARQLADKVITSDKQCGGSFHNLNCLNPNPKSHITQNEISETLASYRRYLDDECGYIFLDGMPADGDVGSRQLRLENLFIPLHIDITININNEKKELKRQSLGSVLNKYQQLALLAAPGGGKSTLVKRLAVAYADSERRTQIDDELPDCNWLPLFFRCRELRGLARGSFSELLDALSQREHIRQYRESFRSHVERELLAGRVLLLIDGLDEIPLPSDRAAFVCTLRTTLRAYPGIAIVITSREAGFRHIATHLAPIFINGTVSTFDVDDIRRLSVAWHREVINDSEKVRADAIDLAETIVKNDRIMRLAINPLLLTTLLLVKRWVGRLPTRRAILYGKAVEVLLITWNVEGHEPIPEEEAIPQLCYLAATMMLNGIQKISRPRLVATLQQARNCLPTELGYVKGTVEDFILRVEDRSSLLMMTGHDVEDGQLVEFFEFRHLTFQEFLTARAMVEGWYPARKEDDTLVSVLESHFKDEKWHEVIPLAAFLGRTATEALIGRLTEELHKLTHSNIDLIFEIKVAKNPQESIDLIVLIGNCLADEAAARPSTIVAAVREMIQYGSKWFNMPFTPNMMRGRYGQVLRQEARDSFLNEITNNGNTGDALLSSVWWQTVESETSSGYIDAASRFMQMLVEGSKQSLCEGAVGCGYLCHKLDSEIMMEVRESIEKNLTGVDRFLLSMINSQDIAEQAASSYALSGLGSARLLSSSVLQSVLMVCYNLWSDSTNETVRSLAARALASFPIIPREDGKAAFMIPIEQLKVLYDKYDKFEMIEEKTAALVIGYYTQEVLSDSQLIEMINKHLKDKGHLPSTEKSTLTEVLNLLENS